MIPLYRNVVYSVLIVDMKNKDVITVKMFALAFNIREIFLLRTTNHHLASNRTIVVGNSSVAIRECSYLGVPAVNIGSRQQGRERGRNVIDVGHDRAAIADALAEHRRRGRPQADHLYGDGRAGTKIADVLASAPLTVEKRLTY